MNIILLTAYDLAQRKFNPVFWFGIFRILEQLKGFNKDDVRFRPVLFASLHIKLHIKRNYFCKLRIYLNPMYARYA